MATIYADLRPVGDYYAPILAPHGISLVIEPIGDFYAPILDQTPGTPHGISLVMLTYEEYMWKRVIDALHVHKTIQSKAFKCK